MKLAILLLCALVAGCAARTVPVDVKFDDADFAPYAGDGNASVKGQAFLRQQGGGVVTCAGQKAVLMPAIPYINEMVRIMRTGAKPIIDANATGSRFVHEAMHQGICDAQGNFTFEDVPPGNWWVGADVTWRVGYAQQGGALLKNITLGNGAPKTVILTDEDLVGAH